MRNRIWALGAVTLLAIGPLGMASAFAVPAGATGPTGSGSSEAETQGSAKLGAVPRIHHPRAGVSGPTGSGSSEAQVQGSGPRTAVNPMAPHRSTGVVKQGGTPVGTSGASH